MLSKSLCLAAGQRVRLPSGLSPFVSLLVGHCVRLVSLLVGHCVRLVPLLSPFVSGLVSLLVGHCQTARWTLLEGNRRETRRTQ